MSFSHPKTIPRQPKLQTSSHYQLPPQVPLKTEIKKNKSTSVAVIKKPQRQQSYKPVFLKNPKINEKKEEEKVEVLPPKTGLFTVLPSKKYTSIKTIDPFADTSKSKMSF